ESTPHDAGTNRRRAPNTARPPKNVRWIRPICPDEDEPITIACREIAGAAEDRRGRQWRLDQARQLEHPATNLEEVRKWIAAGRPRRRVVQAASGLSGEPGAAAVAEGLVMAVERKDGPTPNGGAYSEAAYFDENREV